MTAERVMYLLGGVAFALNLGSMFTRGFTVSHAVAAFWILTAMLWVRTAEIRGRQ